ncbi:MAG: glycerate dehydrogenase [uncultured bacterium]|nr:MAG: glycerate dehydrogenase [uncultured bacterium]
MNEVVAIAPDVEILIAGSSGIEEISKELIDRLPKLKFIALLTVGYNWVDVEYARQKGVLISNIRGANSESVAEHTWGMVLDLAKRITEFDRDARLKGAFKFSDYKGKEIFGKTLGVIGIGDIGTKIVRCSRGFSMKVLGYNRSEKHIEGVQMVSLDVLLTEADVICIAVPLSDSTREMIADKEVSQMKKGVIVVNCAREEIVKKSAIIDGLKKGRVFGYGLETAIMTPIAKEDIYYSFSNIIVSPHNAFNTEDADRNSYDLVLNNIKAFVEGRPQNLV